VRAQRGDPAIGDSGEPELTEILDRCPKARSSDRCVGLEGYRPRPGCPRRLEPEAAALRALDPLDGRIERERASAPRGVLERLEVADAHGCGGEHRSLHGPGGDEKDLPRPRLEAVGELEAGVPLPDDEDALALEFARQGGLRVV